MPIENMHRIVQTTVRHRIALTDGDIRELLAKQGFDIPSSATITVYVPGGGDWSNTELDIGTSHPVCIDWTTHTTENG